MFKKHLLKQFLFSTPFSSFGLLSLLLPSSSLTHFVDASATFAPRQDREELEPPIQTLQPRRYPLMLFENINYYLVGLKVMERTEALAFLTSRIAILPSRIWSR